MFRVLVMSTDVVISTELDRSTDDEDCLVNEPVRLLVEVGEASMVIVDSISNELLSSISPEPQPLTRESLHGISMHFTLPAHTCVGM